MTACLANIHNGPALKHGGTRGENGCLHSKRTMPYKRIGTKAFVHVPLEAGLLAGAFFVFLQVLVWGATNGLDLFKE